MLVMYGRLANQLEAIALVAVACLVAIIGWLTVAQAADLPLLEVLKAMFEGAFGSKFAWTQTLSAATPLLLTGLCVALPAQAGLLIIGGEGAFIVGGLAAAVAARAVPEDVALVALLLGGVSAGALWVGISGWLKISRNVHEAFTGLLLTYVAVAVCNQLVEGILRDPLSNNKPATLPIPETAQIGDIGLFSLHWGLPIGVVACLAAYVFFAHTPLGYELRVLGGNSRAAAFAGLRCKRMIVGICLLSGAIAGLAGSIEVGAIHLRASGGLALGYGYVGILVATLARGNPLAVIFAALMVGALEAGGGLLQRRLDAPVSSAQMMEGLLFISLVIVWAWRGKLAQRLVRTDQRDHT